ncbi:outer membrane protein assembly factor BamA [Megalodesulfovibrio paquesii]
MRVRFDWSAWLSLAPALCLALLVQACPAWAQASDNKNITIAVLPFEVNAEPSLSRLNQDLPKMVAEQLRQAGFTVVEESALKRHIADRGVKFLDLKTARELAVLTKANYAIYGSFSQAGESISLDARLVEAFGQEPARPLFVSKKGLTNVTQAVGELSMRVRSELAKASNIADIKVRGLAYLDDDVVLMRLGVQKGDPYDPTKINEELKRVFDLGYFDDVKVSVEDGGGGKVLIFDVKEKPRIQAIGVLGNSAIDEDDIIEAMATKAGSVLNLKVLSEDLQKIRELYRGKGYYLAQVDYQLEQTGNAQARLNIEVKEAKKLYVSKITVEGATTFSESELKDQMALHERGFISWLTGSGVLKEELLDRDAAVIEDYYANHGFMDAKVSPAKVDYTEEGIVVTYTVEEGARYKVGAITFEGDMLAPEAELEHIVKLDDMAKNGDWFSREVLREDAKRLTNFYNNFGYAFAETDVKFMKTEDKSAINVNFSMLKNQKVTLRRVIIEGNDKTRDNVVRREIMLADGDEFHGGKLQASKENLKRLDLFESYDIETVPTEDPKELDLKVRVKEKSTGTLAGGVGYGSFGGAFVSAKITEKNLFGSGYFLGFSGSFSGKATRFDATFTNPRVWDSQLLFSVNAYYNDQEYTDFDKESVGAVMKFAHPIGYHTVMNVSYGLEQYEIDGVSWWSSSDLQKEVGTHWASVVTLGAVRNTTNREQNPSEGSKASITLSLGGGPLGGDDDFVKAVADYHLFYTMPWGKEHIFHFHTQAGIITPLEDDVPVFERFYLGGMNSLRGYEELQVSPREGIYRDVVGGDKMAFANFEYLFPLYQEFGLQGVTFFDIGDSWGNGDSVDLSLKKSVGAGLRWFSPFGPLRVEYGYALDTIPEQGDKYRVEFSMGQNF